MNITNLRGVARLVNHTAFKKLAMDNNQSAYIRQLKKYSNWGCIEPESKPQILQDLIDYSYELLVNNYRNEYVYKSTLLNDFVLKHHSLDNTIILNEFRINNSIADVVLINGTNKVFEIKTELDNLERLESQVIDYYKVFSEVNLVTHHSLYHKYAPFLQDTVGILLYTEEGNIEEVKKAQVVRTFLDIKTMMATLRRAEYMKLVKSLVGFVPDATPVYMYTECLKVLLQFTPKEVQVAYQEILKQRISKEKNLLINEGVFSKSLNYSYYNLKINKKSYITLNNNLNKKI